MIRFKLYFSLAFTLNPFRVCVCLFAIVRLLPSFICPVSDLHTQDKTKQMLHMIHKIQSVISKWSGIDQCMLTFCFWLLLLVLFLLHYLSLLNLYSLYTHTHTHTLCEPYHTTHIRTVLMPFAIRFGREYVFTFVKRTGQKPNNAIINSILSVALFFFLSCIRCIFLWLDR